MVHRLKSVCEWISLSTGAQGTVALRHDARNLELGTSPWENENAPQRIRGQNAGVIPFSWSSTSSNTVDSHL